MREVVGAQNLKINILTVPNESMASFRVPYSQEALAKVVSCAMLGDPVVLRRLPFAHDGNPFGNETTRDSATRLLTKLMLLTPSNASSAPR
jgi:hypothetical protein